MARARDLGLETRKYQSVQVMPNKPTRPAPGIDADLRTAGAPVRTDGDYYHLARQQIIEQHNGFGQTVSQVVYGIRNIEKVVCIHVNEGAGDDNEAGAA